MARHVIDELAALADGEMESVDRARVDAHLGVCASCHEAWERYRFTANLLRGLTTVEAPPAIWTSIEAALDGRSTSELSRAVWWRGRPAYVLAALLVLSIATGMWWHRTRPAPWDVIRTDVAETVRLATGEWIETDASSTATFRIGEIGVVDIAPNTRMQLLAARPDEHRLNLAHGQISAMITAPPRIFFVETPSSTVVDLGCAYTMQVDSAGAGILRMTEGWAALEWNGRQSLVPAGASCSTRPGAGPGTPSFDDASDRLKQALAEFDAGADADDALDVILSEARDRDTLTLWHLMSRVAPEERARVFDRLVALTPLPAGVDRDKALTLDPGAMRLWLEELAWTW